MNGRALTFPIHTGEIDGLPVRFFKGPVAGPELPWHALEDLYRTMRLPRPVRRQLLERTRAFPDGEARTVASADGLATIAPNYMAQGIIGAAVEVHGVRADFEHLYIPEAIAALKVLTSDMPVMASIQYAVEAFRNSARPRR